MQDQITDNTTDEKPLESAEVVDLRAEVMDSFEMYALQEFSVDDVSKIAQSQFNYCLMYVRDRYIMHYLGIKKLMYGYSYDNILDDNKLIDVFEYYIALCIKYNKHVCDYGFECFSGIDTSSITRWRVDKKASKEKTEIAKRLVELNQESLKDFLADGKRNPVGVVAILNNLHGWSDKRIKHEIEAAPESLAAIADKIGTALPG